MFVVKPRCTVLSRILWYSHSSTADGFPPVAFGSEGRVALGHACYITQLPDPAVAFDHMNGLSQIGWQRRPPGTISSLCREVKNKVLLLLNLLDRPIRPWPVSDLWCLYCACAENTNVQWAKHGEGKVFSVSVSWWSKQTAVQPSRTSAFWWLVPPLCHLHCMKVFYKGWNWTQKCVTGVYSYSQDSD